MDGRANSVYPYGARRFAEIATRLFALHRPALRDADVEEAIRTQIGEILEDTTDFDDSNDFDSVPSPRSDGRGSGSRCRPVLHVLNVGQGDAILLDAPNGEDILFDSYFGGNRLSLLQNETGRIKRLVITHFHSDHIEHATQVMSKFNIQEVIIPDHVHISAMALAMLKFASGSSRLRVLRKRAKIVVDPSLHVDLYSTRPHTRSRKDPNKNAIVAHVRTDAKNAFLAADVPANLLMKLMTGEGLLAEGAVPPKADYYKVTHHCSQTGNSQKLLNALAPCISVTSYGHNNRFHGTIPHTLTKSLIDNCSGAHFLTADDGTQSLPM